MTRHTYNMFKTLAVAAVVSLAFAGCASTDSEFPAAPNDARYDFVNSVGIRMVYVQPGEFNMGSPHLEFGRKLNEDMHTVRITRGYYMGIFEITRGQFEQFAREMALQGGHNLGQWADPGYYQGSDDNPVVNVSWYDAVAFCQWLSAKEGRNYRLPTEADWEYAGRAGSGKAFDNGHWTSRLEENIDGIAWRSVYGDVTQHVGRYPPNAWGLYDIHGNVQEWTADFYCAYEPTFQTNPLGPPGGCDRVVRGGFFNAYPVQSRSAFRIARPPTVRSNAIGFRVVMEAEDCPPGAPMCAPPPSCDNCLTIHAVDQPCKDYAPWQNRAWPWK